MGLEEEEGGLWRWLWVGVGQCVNRTPEPEWAHREEEGDTWFLSPCPQDVDEVFFSKMELEGKLDTLREYICFLRRLYEEVRMCQGQKWCLQGQGVVRGRDRVGRLPVATVGVARK